MKATSELLLEIYRVTDKDPGLLRLLQRLPEADVRTLHAGFAKALQVGQQQKSPERSSDDVIVRLIQHLTLTGTLDKLKMGDQLNLQKAPLVGRLLRDLQNLTGGVYRAELGDRQYLIRKTFAAGLVGTITREK